MTKCTSRTTLQFKLAAKEKEILFSNKTRGSGYVRVGREKAVPKDAHQNYVGFTTRKDAGAPVRRVLNTIKHASILEVETIQSCLQSILNGERAEINGREMTDFHRGILERRLTAVREKHRALTLTR